MRDFSFKGTLVLKKEVWRLCFEQSREKEKRHGKGEKMKIRKIDKDKKQYLELLLLGDEQESMIDRYLEKGDMYVLQEEGAEENRAAGVCVVTAESDEILELKNIAVAPEYQHQGWGRRMIAFLENTYSSSFRILQAGTGDVPATVLFYEACGFHRSHRIPDFFTKNYDHPIYECGKLLTDMVYFQKKMELVSREGEGDEE